MQSLNWYWGRLRTMSVAEVAWRLQGRLRDVTDRVRPVFLRRGLSRAAQARIASTALPDASAWPECVWDAGPRGTISERHAQSDRAAVEEAERVLAGRIRLLGDQEIDVGQRIDWNREYRAGIRAPMGFAPAIDYRDYRVTGDCKWVWELNRHHHLVVLGRAFRATGDARYSAAVVARMLDWIEQCPFGRGMNWRSGLELAIRLINWVWALALIRPSGAVDAAAWRRIAPTVWLHLWEIARKYSRHSSANNHLIGEAAGVYIGASYFDPFPRASEWRRAARRILIREIAHQTHEDGGNREQAFGYHQFVAQFLLLAGLCGEARGDGFGEGYWRRLDGMFDFSAALLASGRDAPMYGDADDGYVLDLGGRGDARAWLAAAARVRNRPDWEEVAGLWSGSDGSRAAGSRFLPTCGPALWLVRSDERQGTGSRHLPGSLQSPNAEGVGCLGSRAFPDSGFYLLQYGRPGSPDAVSVTFDCGPLGFQSIAAHGHADALAITLRAGGLDILVDPGTYDYFTHPQWRTYFRSTRAHNTVGIDGKDQSEMRGPFMWGAHAQAWCENWDASENGGSVTGAHDGYGGLADSVLHRRQVTLDGPGGEIVVEDELAFTGTHSVELFFHFSEHCTVRDLGEGRYEAATAAGNVELILDGRLAGELTRGCVAPFSGWLSRAYHCKVPTFCLTGRCLVTGGIRLTTRILVRLGRTGSRGALAPAGHPQSTAAGSEVGVAV